MVTEHGVCTECGQHTPLRLPRRFPHICTECLFPPCEPADESHEGELYELGRPPSLVKMLHERAKLAPLKDTFGAFRKGRPGYNERPPR